METMQDTLKRLGITRVAEFRGVTEYKLEANGLKILLVEDHKRPVVLVDLLYRIGSRNEANGYTGSAHFFEHLMFKGTKDRHPKDGRGIDDLLKPVGAIYNANTWLDRTQYFELLPAAQLELGLAIEFDRMRNLEVTTEDRNSEMTVVRSEFEIGKNDPEQLIDELGWKTAFTEHAYHWSTIGYLNDVENVPLERMKEFYDTFYHPNNATCIVVGDFDPQEALTLIHKHAGHIPPSPKPIPEVYTKEPPQSGERRFELCKSGSLPLLWMGFHIPEARHKDIYALAVAAAILGSSGRRSSRLYKRLIDTALAAGVSCHAQENRDPSLFILSATVGHGNKVEDVEKVILEELERLAKEPVSEAELKRVKDANRKGTTLGRADILSFQRQLAEAEAVADWQWMVEYDDKFEAVTADDIMRVVRTYLNKKNRTVGHFLPEGQEAESEDNAAAGAVSESGSPVATLAPVPASKLDPKSFAAQVTKTVLPNGLTVQVMPMKGTGSVSVSGKVRAGGFFAPQAKSLLAALTASMLDKGSTNYDKATVAETLESMGAGLRFAANNFTVGFGTMVVTEDLPSMLNMTADLLKNPLFDAEEFKRAKRRIHSGLIGQADDPGAVAGNRLTQALYGAESVYHDKQFAALIGELGTIEVADLKSFHSENYSPKGTIISVVGDIDPAQALELVKAAFGSWTGPEPKQIDDAQLAKLGDRACMSSVQKAERIEVPMADKTSVSIVIGLAALLKRSSPDYFAAMLANAALGHDTLSARLGLVVREKHGLTYGIRSTFQDLTFNGAPWLITLDTNPVNVEKALALTGEVVKSYVENGITDQELSNEQGRAAGEFDLRLRNSSGIANILTDYEFLGLGVAALDSFASDVKAVTKDEVNEAIRKYFRLDESVTVLAGTLAS
jgi:zinc protease